MRDDMHTRSRQSSLSGLGFSVTLCTQSCTNVQVERKRQARNVESNVLMSPPERVSDGFVIRPCVWSAPA